MAFVERKFFTDPKETQISLINLRNEMWKKGFLTQAEAELRMKINSCLFGKYPITR